MEERVVTLELRSEGGTASAVEARPPLTSREWADLLRIGAHGSVDVVVRRDVLAKESTYFRSLLGNFREASLDRVNVNWDNVSFLSLLQFIFCGGYEMSSSNVATLLEVATFFGVDRALSAVEGWARSSISPSNPEAVGRVVEDLPYIWKASIALGNGSLSNFCRQFLAINFMIVSTLASFSDLPFTLLSESVAHPELTVHSESQLCEALLRWYENGAGGSESGEPNTDKLANLLSEVQGALLPKHFLLGRLRKNCHVDVRKSTIRITDYQELLDLSGCCNLSDLALFESSARAPIGPPEGRAPTLDLNFHYRRLTSSWQAYGGNDPAAGLRWLKIPSFNNLRRLNLSQCWRISQDALLAWLGQACPRLLELTMTNCPQITIRIPRALASACPSLELLDISIDTVLVDCKEEDIYCIEDNSYAVCRDISQHTWEISSSSLKKVSLQGHLGLSENELMGLAVCCPMLLEIDLSSCTALTDGGIGKFLRAYPTGLKSFKAKQTAVGPLTWPALISAQSSDRDSSTPDERVPLLSLDLQQCHGLEEADLAAILRHCSCVTHLNLGDTNLSDMALSQFKGTSLQLLNVRETKVSGKTLASVIGSNPGLKTLDMRGCTRTCIDDLDSVTEGDGHLPTMRDGLPVFQELGKRHRMEDLKVGWIFSGPTQLGVRPDFASLVKLVVGIGATVHDASLQSLRLHCPALKQLSLTFQPITEDGLIAFLDKSEGLDGLELQYCSLRLSSRGISSLAANCSNLRTLRLVRVAPRIADSDISTLSQRCGHLSQLSLVGCKALTAESLKLMAKNWCGLTHLRLEECNTLTAGGVDCLLQSCGALERLVLRHNGKGMSKDFVGGAVTSFPLLRHLSLDFCDALAGGFRTPSQAKFVLNTLFISRCKARLHRDQLGLPSDSSEQGGMMCHKQTVVTQWNADKIRVVKVTARL